MVLASSMVSIITPVYNVERFLAETIESVLNQSFQSWELLLIVDAKSKDGSRQIAQKYAALDDRIRFIEGPETGGVAVNRNLGLSRAKGKYVAFLDSDDIWETDKLKHQVTYMDSAEVGMSYTSFSVIDEDGERAGPNRIAKYKVGGGDLLKNNCIGCLTVMIRRDLLAGLKFESSYHEDLLFWIRFLSDGRQAHPIRENLARYRIVKGARSHNKILCAVWRWQLHRKLGLGPFSALYYQCLYAFFAVLKRSELLGVDANQLSDSPNRELISTYENKLVSVIMPAFNSGKTIRESVDSVIAQTYTDWELIVVDDGSSDSTEEIIRSYQDSRISYVKNEKNLGAAESRNRGLSLSKGRFIAFLDADDKWTKDKLKVQLEFMKEMGTPFSYTAYDVIDENSVKKGQFFPPARVSYWGLLKSNSIGCLTAIYDREYFGTVYFPKIRKRQDFALWLVLLKRCDFAVGVPRVLAEYRVGAKSLSSNKLKVFKSQWQVYREFEGFSVVRSAWFFANYILYGTFKRILKYRA